MLGDRQKDCGVSSVERMVVVFGVLDKKLTKTTAPVKPGSDQIQNIPGLNDVDGL